MVYSPAFAVDGNLEDVKQVTHETNISDSTASLSSNDSSSDLSSRIEELELSLLRTNMNDVESSSNSTDNSFQQRKKSVRFSQVYTREYDVVNELPSPLDHEDEVPRRTLGWNYSESQIDLESHLQEVMVQKRERYIRLIHDHLLRTEKERKERGNERPKKKWKARVMRGLKYIGQSLMDAATRNSLIMTSVPV